MFVAACASPLCASHALPRPSALYLFTHRKDQEFYDDSAIQRAVEEAARFLKDRQLRNVFVDIIHEYSHRSE